MGAAASTIPENGATLEQFKQLSGDRFDEEWFNKNKNEEGLVSKDQLMEYHRFVSGLNRYKTNRNLKLVDLTPGKFASSGNMLSIVKPEKIIPKGTFVESDKTDFMFRGTTKRDTIETHCLHLPEYDAWIMGWNTTLNSESVIDMFVTDEKELPIVVKPLPEEKKRQVPDETPDDAVKVIQKAARNKAKSKKDIHANDKPEDPTEEESKEPAISNLRKFKVIRDDGCHVSAVGTTDLTGEVIPEGAIIEAEDVTEVPNVLSEIILVGHRGKILYKQGDNVFLDEVDVNTKPTYTGP